MRVCLMCLALEILSLGAGDNVVRTIQERIALPITVGMGPNIRIYCTKGVLFYEKRGTEGSTEPKSVLLYDCWRVKKAPKLTGKLEDPLWKDLPVGTNFVRGLYKEPPFPLAEKQTDFRVCYDDEALYIGIEFFDPDVKDVLERYTKYDDRIWWDDSVEIYIEPGFSHRKYYKFMSNPIGTRHDAYAENALYGFLMDSAWGSGTSWSAVAGKGKSAWYVEMRIPFVDIEASTPEEGELYSFQVVRFCRTMWYEKKGKRRRGRSIRAGHREETMPSPSASVTSSSPST